VNENGGSFPPDATLFFLKEMTFAFSPEIMLSMPSPS
jgi:hypothetical protein